jgi:hypothetical protein
MKTKSFFFSIVISFAVFACEETDAPVLEGDIHGTVSLNDAYGFPVSDKSGVQVQLTGEDAELETTTDSYGQYIFQDLPFGKYYINLNKENYVEADRNFSIGHIGGDAPTLISLVMNEIPEYYYGIDSMTYCPSYSNFNIYMHTLGATKAFVEYRSFYVHCFFSQSPDVSCENYENSFFWITSTRTALYYTFWYGSNHFLNEYTGTVYCRIYPQTYYNEIWGSTYSNSPVYPETLGPPSEVFSFTVEGITRTNPDY